MRNFRNFVGSMIVVLVATLFISALAIAQGQGKGQGQTGGLPALQAQLDAEEIARATADADLQGQIDTIELTPGPKGDKGDTGATGAKGDTGDTGPSGADGEDGLSIQGPQGEPGTSSWIDGFETVSTTGSIQIGNDTADCTSANAGTIRFNGTTFQGCDGVNWIDLNGSVSDPPVLTTGEIYSTDFTTSSG